MKRTITACLLALVLCMSLCVNAFAAELTVTQPGEVKKGDTISFEVRISQKVLTKSGGIMLKFNTQVLSVTDYKWNLENPMIQMFDKETGVGVFAYKDAVEIEDLVFAATLQVKDDAAYGDASVSVDLKFKNSDAPENDISIEGVRSEIYVSCMNHTSGAQTGVCKVCGKHFAGNPPAETTQPTQAAVPGVTIPTTAPSSAADTEPQPKETEAATAEATAEATTGAAEDIQPTQPQKDTQPQEPKNPLIPILIVAVIVLAAGAAAVLFAHKGKGGKYARKKK